MPTGRGAARVRQQPPQDGWTSADNGDNGDNGEVWQFSNPVGREPPTGGDADFAVEDPGDFNYELRRDDALVSPVLNPVRGRIAGDYV